MRAIASDNHSTLARRHRKRLLPINTPLAAPARWKRRVPRGRFSFFRASFVAIWTTPPCLIDQEFM